MAYSHSEVLLSLLALCAAGAYGCNEHVPLLPPCPTVTHYSTERCTILDPVTNATRLQTQCVKVEPRNVYESWQFWTAIVAVLVVITIAIVSWRCCRHTQCYRNLSYDLRHEKNRTCARFCVAHCCTCKTCVKCCEPYTRPTNSELHAEQAVAIDLSKPYHDRIDVTNNNNHHHHHHHLHLHPENSECIHPEDDETTKSPNAHQHAASRPAGVDPAEGKTLDEVCVSSIVLA